MIDKVQGKRIGADINPYLIDALIAIRDCVTDLPKNNTEFTEDDYKQLRKSDDYKYKGYAGFAFSYSGKWLGGWCRDGLGKRDYVNESYKNALNQNPLLQGVRLVNESYLDLQIPENSLIYCDPPYEGTTKYKDDFDHPKFWQWCRDKVSEGHIVFVSEYNAPDDFECVWEKEMVSSLTQDTGSKKAVEKLFKFSPKKCSIITRNKQKETFNVTIGNIVLGEVYWTYNVAYLPIQVKVLEVNEEKQKAKIEQGWIDFDRLYKTEKDCPQR